MSDDRRQEAPVTAASRPAGTGALFGEVKNWLQAEARDGELQNRVAVALDEIKEFVTRHQTDLERRKGRLIQTTGFKDETRSMEAALKKIRLLVTGGRNISTVFAAIGDFLDAYKGDETFDKEHVRAQLAEAREDSFCRFHDSIRGTRLSELLDILYFMPYSYWRYRSLEKRNFRSPSAAEVSKLLDEFRQRGIDVDRLDTVQLAAMIRIRLGITPRMDYHLMPDNKLAEKLAGEELIARYSSGETPLDEGFSRTAARILADVRRWSGECFGSTLPPAPPEIEAELLQLVYFASDVIRLVGTGNERSADYLWSLATVVGSDHAVLKDALTAPVDRHVRHPSIRERIVSAKTYLDEISARADGILASLWSEAKGELDSLTARTDAIASKSRPAFSDFTELEGLKEKRSDVVKSLIKLSDAIQLIEPSLLDALASPALPAARHEAGGRGGPLDPGQLRDRNYRTAEETKAIARQELERLRRLIVRIGEISRGGFAGSGTAPSPSRREEKGQRSRRTSDGVELAALPNAKLQAMLCGFLGRLAASLREFRSKVDGVRRRTLKSDVQHALNVLYEKTRRAADVSDGADLDAGGAAHTSIATEAIETSLRDLLMAQTHVVARMKTAKLTPAEKQALNPLMAVMKLRLGDDLRDLEALRTELAQRSAGTEATACVEAAGAAVDMTTEREAAADKIASLVSQSNNALRPVKSLMIGFNETCGSEPLDCPAIRSAATALTRGITEAQEVMAANWAQIEALAAEFSLASDDFDGRFSRWRGQLAALEGETGRLLEALAGVADIREAVATAVALDKGIADTLRPPPGGRNKAEPFVPVRRRCLDALAAIGGSLTRIREVQNRLAAAREAEWRILKTASRSMGSLSRELAALEKELQDTQARIEAVHNQFKSDRPPPRRG